MGKSFAYVSIMSTQRGDRSVSRSRSLSKPKGNRSSSTVRSAKSSHQQKPKQFRSIRHRVLEQQKYDSNSIGEGDSVLGPPFTTQMSHDTTEQDYHNSSQQAPPTGSK